MTAPPRDRPDGAWCPPCRRVVDPITTIRGSDPRVADCYCPRCKHPLGVEWWFAAGLLYPSTSTTGRPHRATTHRQSRAA